jgi:predicted GNAT family acetyltransferase
MSDGVRNNTALNRFELDIDGAQAVAYYQMAPGVITFTHTEVPQAMSGQGVATRLIRGALDMVRAQGLRVVSRCPFVSAFLGKHPEYNDLIW